MKSHLGNNSCLPIYKTNPAVCDNPHQTQCAGNSIFPHFVMVMTVLRAKLWFVVVCCVLHSVIFGWCRRNHTPRMIPCLPSLYSTRVLNIVILDSLCSVFYGTVHNQCVYGEIWQCEYCTVFTYVKNKPPEVLHMGINCYGRRWHTLNLSYSLNTHHQPP